MNFLANPISNLKPSIYSQLVKDSGPPGPCTWHQSGGSLVELSPSPAGSVTTQGSYFQNWTELWDTWLPSRELKDWML